MEVIGIGILFMIGIYLAPVVFGLAVLVIGGVFSIIGSLFGGKK